MLHLFSGEPDREDGVSAVVGALGGVCEDFDILAGDAQNLLDDAAFEALLERVASFDVIVIGVDCSTFSIARAGRPPLRTRPSAAMAPGLCPADQERVRVADELVRRSCVLARAAWEAGGDFVFENPADYAIQPALWAAHAHIAPLWIHPEMVATQCLTGAASTTFPQCMLGAPARKYTSLLYSAGLASLGELGLLRCVHRQHSERAFGRDHLGRGRAGRAARYPAALCSALAHAAALAAGVLCDDCDEEGEIGFGPALHPRVREACAVARHSRRPFASHERAVGLESVERWRAAMPAQSMPAQWTAAAESSTAAQQVGLREHLVGRYRHLVLNRRYCPWPPDDAVVVDRNSRWGNRARRARWRTVHEHASVANAFWEALLSDGELLTAARFELCGRPLLCHCAPLPCHAGVLAAVANCSDSELALLLRRDDSGVADLVAPLSAASAIDEDGSDNEHDSIALSTPSAPPAPSEPPAVPLPTAPSSPPPLPTRPSRRACSVPGAPRGRIAAWMLWRPVGGSRPGWDSWVAWRDAAAPAMAALSRGEPAEPPGTVVISADLMEPWARRFRWDCRDPDDCVPLRRSSRRTVFPGPRQADRAAVRAAAQALSWEDIDPDILAQVGEGGIESRSMCSDDTVLSWHHGGATANFAVADKAIRKDAAEGWLLGPFCVAPPILPMRCLPRNVIHQTRQRLLPGGSLESYEKPRITTNSSDLDGDSVNGAVADGDRTVGLPSGLDFAAGAGVVDSAGDGGAIRAETYCIDLESAYRFLVLQRADWGQHCFFWIDAHGRAGVFIDIRLAFGGAYAPNRFQRFSLLVRAAVVARQDAFDAQCPYPSFVGDWVTLRRRRQAQQLLPPGVDQLRPAHSQVFIDDLTGSALNDPVAVPAELAAVDSGAALTIAGGGTPSAASSRALVHAGLAALAAQSFGLVVAPKTVCGDGVTGLGLHVSVLRDAVTCPSAKRDIIMAVLASQTSAVSAGLALDGKEVGTLVGRLTNLSQIMPSLLGALHEGYAVAAAGTTGVRSCRHRPPLVLGSGSRRQRGYLRLLALATEVVGDNSGLPLVCQPAFPMVGEPGVLTVVTDASGEDGVGGYAFLPERPREVFIASEPWPSDVRAALLASTVPHTARAAEVGPVARLAMPAAELFGSLALEVAVADAGVPFTSVVTVTDCRPGALAIRKGKSRSRQMRSLLLGIGARSTRRLGVHIPRTLNTSADTLSHPAQCGRVIRQARAARLSPVAVTFSTEAWEQLRVAMAPSHR